MQSEWSFKHRSYCVIALPFQFPISSPSPSGSCSNSWASSHMLSGQRIPNVKCIQSVWHLVPIRQRHLLLQVDAAAPGNKVWAGFQPCSHLISACLFVGHKYTMGPAGSHQTSLSLLCSECFYLLNLYPTPIHPSLNQDNHPPRSFHLFYATKKNFIRACLL